MSRKPVSPTALRGAGCLLCVYPVFSCLVFLPSGNMAGLTCSSLHYLYPRLSALPSGPCSEKLHLFPPELHSLPPTPAMVACPLPSPLSPLTQL